MLLAVAGLVLSLAFPAFQLVGSDYLLQLYPYGAQGDAPAAITESILAMSPVAMGSLLTLIAASGLEIAAIFLFKKRPLQIRLVSLANILVALMLAILSYAAYNLSGAHPGTGLVPGAGLLPLLAVVIFNLLALRGIRADEKLVKDMHRLR